MELLKSAENFDQMKRVERELIAVLLKYRDNTESALMVFALLRCARVLIRKYSGTTQKDLKHVAVDFLEGRTSPRDDPDAGGLILQ